MGKRIPKIIALTKSPKFSTQVSHVIHAQHIETLGFSDWITRCLLNMVEAKEITSQNEIRRKLAGGLGFEPRLAESESAVLPLDDPPTGRVARRRRTIETGSGLVNAAHPGA